MFHVLAQVAFHELEDEGKGRAGRVAVDVEQPHDVAVGERLRSKVEK